MNKVDTKKQEKVVVPRYVAEFYESIKDDFDNGVYELCVEIYKGHLQTTKLGEWFTEYGNTPIKILVHIHKFGYEIEEE